MKVIRTVLVCAGALGCIILPNVELNAQNNVSSETMLGKTINAVGAKNYGDISKYSVLSQECYESIDYNKNNLIALSKSTSIHNSSRESILKSLKTSFTIESKVNDLPIEMFTLSASNRFSFEESYSESKFASSEFFTISSKKDYCEYYIENLEYKCKNDFSNHFSDYYLNALSQVNNKRMEYQELFEKFGTHLIGAYTLGDRLSIDVIVSTNSTIISDSSKTSISNELKAQCGKTGASIESTKDFLSEYNMEQSSTYTKVEAYTNSSIIPNVTDITNIHSGFEYWNNNTNENTGTIVEYDENSLIPLWKMLPADYREMEEDMKAAFLKYADSKKWNIPSSVDHTFPETIENTYYRESNETITDCDRFSNYIDKFSLNTIYGVDLLRKKYDHITIDFSFDVKKKKLGDRYVYLYYAEDAYKGSDKHDDYIYSSSISCALSGKWYSRERSITIKCSDLRSTDFALVWRAKGTGKDKWYCDDCDLTITCYK